MIYSFIKSKKKKLKTANLLGRYSESTGSSSLFFQARWGYNEAMLEIQVSPESAANQILNPLSHTTNYPFFSKTL